MPAVTLSLERSIYLRIVQHVRGTDYSMNNVLVEACRRLAGEPHAGKPSGGGHGEMQPGGPSRIPEGDPITFNGNVGPGTLKAVRAHAERKQVTTEAAMIAALKRLLAI